MFSLYSPVKVYGTLILLAMLGLNFFYIHHLRAVNRDLVAWKTNYLIEQQLLTDTQRLQNAEKKLEGEATLRQVDAERKLALEKLNLTTVNRDELQKKVETLNVHLQQTKTLLDSSRSNISDSLRLQSERNKLASSQEPQATCGISSSDSNNADYSNLIEACKLTTIDLVECQGIVDADTKAVGREQ